MPSCCIYTLKCAFQSAGRFHCCKTDYINIIFESAYRKQLQMSPTPHRMSADTSSPVRFDTNHYVLAMAQPYLHPEFPVSYVLCDYKSGIMSTTYCAILKRSVSMKQAFSVMVLPNFLFLIYTGSLTPR